jgi:homoserine kinase
LEAAALEGDVQSLTGALDVATQNLAAARAAENRAADEEKARQLLDVAVEFDTHVDNLATALDALGAACNGIRTLHTKAGSLGAQRPIRKQLDIMVGRVVVTALMRAGLQQQVGVEFLAPADRKTADVLYQYVDVIRTDANARIVGENREAA